jgi:poly-beta-1,6-N-acetyl-D-glucosamine synthase
MGDNSTMLSYAVVTPARDEAERLPTLAAALAAQTELPRAWIVVDAGSADGTAAAGGKIAEVVRLDEPAPTARGLDARAFEAGLGAVPDDVDVIVKVDADISLPPDYFERLLAAFASDPNLGIASGTCFELRDGRWQRRNVTGSSVWGAARAYRRACLAEVQPLEPRIGWDGVDEIRANALGWTTRTIPDLPFRHHRGEGTRDGSAAAPRLAQGRAAWYMGYSPLYLVARSLHHAPRDPAALAMVWGYAAAAIDREPRLDDPEARAYLRGQQRFRDLRARRREATGG